MTALLMVASVTLFALTWYWSYRMGKTPDIFGYKIVYAIVGVSIVVILIAGFWIGYISRGAATP